MRAIAVLCLAPACVYFASDDDDSGGGDDCPAREAPPDIDPAPQRNPENLLCQSVGTDCDPACGPCPLSPEVTWGVCGSPCEALGEAACAEDPGCRVAKFAECEISIHCLTSFMGCFPVDQSADTSIDCFAADAWSCSRSSGCSALHSIEACPTDAECPRPFELCVREGSSPGRCHDMVTCRALPPKCPDGTTPGVLGECWSGACIPNDLCEPAP